MKKILVIDDDSYICNLLVNYLGQNGYKAEGTISGVNGMKRIEQEKFHAVLCDYRLPESDGLTVLQHIKTHKPSLPVIIMTAYADVKIAVQLIKAGAFDYVTKPIQPEEILKLVGRAVQAKKQNTNNAGAGFKKDFVVGTSYEIKEVMHHVDVVAPTELNVLIQGETGSGKEYIARAIHLDSARKSKPFVAVDCGAIPKELANSELFGHVKGAFTGAINDKKGYFQQAEGGTLFLDEVGNLPYENQVKLLRAIQERVINRVGDHKSIKVDVRLIAATNDELLQSLEDNDFREDLYHRLNEFKIRIPSLRERIQDLDEFVKFFISRANQSFNKQVQGISEEVKTMFNQYQWYGNIRELQNVINRAVLLARTECIEIDAIPDEIKFAEQHPLVERETVNKQTSDLKEATEVTEKELITNALIKTNHNKSQAAKLLNIDRKTLYNKLKHYQINL